MRRKHKNNGNRNREYHVLVSVRDENFVRIDEFSCSGKNAIVDTIYRLDQKFSPPAIEIIKKFW